MASVRVLCAFRIPITAIITALALSGCMRTTGPVAVAAAPRSRFNSLWPAQQSAATAGRGRLRRRYRRASRGLRRHTPESVPVVVAAPVAYVEPVPVRYEVAYHLDAGDRLRVVVDGQEGLTNTYAIDAGGSITMPLIGSVRARGRTTAGLAAAISAKLRAGFIREPSVAVEIEAYRPFFILGEVAAPGQYPYVPHMTVESAVAIAGGFSPRARRDSVTVTHTDASGTARFIVPPGSLIGPGDTVLVGERWF